ncbi:MAG: amidase [Chloroflexaceae bacterium]|jgi:aspartyl-tRNA(Asn)/glutamyl-tRNA(Gln) amidotransferase subunit A|nr:amidase [Chloroflexaceae bacterium]
MADQTLPATIINRLRHNLQAAAIPATDDDLAGIVEKGFLSRMPDFERLLEETSGEVVPDYLGWEAPPKTRRPTSIHLPPNGERGIGPVATQLRNRERSPVELVEACLAQVAARDPQTNAMQLLLAEEARAAAHKAEAEIAAGYHRGLLHGVPVAVKDLLAMAGTVTTAGSKILAGHVTDYDATAVARLRAAGAIIIGKTRMSEYAYSPGSNNSHYGSTANPHNLDHDAGGSSSGSAAAVATGMAYAALGSDTGGSIRIPATHCGVVGFKPTYGRLSLHGAVPLSWSLDHLGPLTQTVADSAIMLLALSGHDPLDRRTRQNQPSPVPEHLHEGVAGLRIGVLRDDGSGNRLASDEVLGAWRAGLARLEAAGATLVELDMLEMERLRLLNVGIMAMEAAAYHTPNLRTRLDDFGPFMRQRVLAAFAYGPGAFQRAQQARAVLRQRCLAYFQQVDLISTPPVPEVAPPLGTPTPTFFTGPFNLLGWPAIVVPCGRSSSGVPLAMQLVGKPWDEATVLRAAAVVEAR